MNATYSSLRRRQIAAWVVVSIFVLGFFTPVGMWTGPVLSAWLAGTQRVGRGFVLMMGFAVLFGLPHLVHSLLHGVPGSLPAFLGWMLGAMVLGTFPFTFHRMVSPRLPGWLSTLPLPVFGVVFAAIAGAWLPVGFASGDMLGMPLQQARRSVRQQCADVRHLLVRGNADVGVEPGVSAGEDSSGCEHLCGRVGFGGGICAASLDQ